MIEKKAVIEPGTTPEPSKPKDTKSAADKEKLEEHTSKSLSDKAEKKLQNKNDD